MGPMLRPGRLLGAIVMSVTLAACATPPLPRLWSASPTHVGELYLADINGGAIYRIVAGD